MINERGHKSKLLEDQWTAITRDGGYSAQWEHTVMVTDTGCEILTS
jgi:methionyl aminopeptidase